MTISFVLFIKLERLLSELIKINEFLCFESLKSYDTVLVFFYQYYFSSTITQTSYFNNTLKIIPKQKLANMSNFFVR